MPSAHVYWKGPRVIFLVRDDGVLMETGCGPRFAYSSAERKGVPEKEKKLEAEIAELYAKAGRSPSHVNYHRRNDS